MRDEALKQRHASSRIWNETWLSAFFHKPCNHELFVLQSLNMEGAPDSLSLPDFASATIANQFGHAPVGEIVEGTRC